MKAAFNSPPPMGWNGNHQIQLFEKFRTKNMKSENPAKLNGQLLVVLVLHLDNQLLQQAPVVSHRNRGFESEVKGST